MDIQDQEFWLDEEWFYDNAKGFRNVDKKTSKELSKKYNCKVCECYHNTFISDFRGRYRYFEGYVIDNNLPTMAHSWLVDRSSGKVIDPTLIIDVGEMVNRCGDCYFGIEIPRDWLKKTALELGRTGPFITEYYNYKRRKQI